MVKTSELVSFLKGTHISTTYIDRLKIVCRPYICPFADLVNYVNEGDNVLDVGCGSGQFCLLLAEFTNANKISGLEINAKLIKNANHLLSGYKKPLFSFDLYNGLDFPESIGDADIIYLIDVVHHVPSKFQILFLENISKRMKVGARLVIKDINGASPLVFFNKIHDILFSREIGHELSTDRTANILAASGLSVIFEQKKRMYVYPHYTIVAKK